ncbi:MAG TPA: hypothetical protein VGP47_07765 [Parachlamydiaceae bacterium]|nr:hypothetical protein [Parachlamydiaceae bacterium]
MSIQSQPSIMTAAGIGGTMLGANMLAEGHIVSGTQAVFLGITSLNLGGRCQGLNPQSHANLMKCALLAGTGVIGIEGASRFERGINHKDSAEIIKGGIQTVAGMAGTALLYSLDARIIVVTHQALGLALTSSCVAKLGFNDLVRGCHIKGISKMVLGVGGVFSAASYAYYEYNQMFSAQKTPLVSNVASETLTEDQIEFLKTHNDEIEEIYETKKLSGNWKLFGSGASKKAYTHEKLPGMLIKIPRSEKGFRGNSGDDDLILHHTNLEDIRNIAVKFDRIVLPKSNLYQISKGHIIVEERLDLEYYFDFEDSKMDVGGKEQASDQFLSFVKASDLCDVGVKGKHNAGMMSQNHLSKVGIIDVDCRNFQVDEKLKREFKISDTSTLNSVVNSVANWSIATLVAKNILHINPSIVFGVGLAGVAVAAQILNPLSDPFQQAATLAVTGISMAATAIVTLAITKAFSGLKVFV